MLDFKTIIKIKSNAWESIRKDSDDKIISGLGQIIVFNLLFTIIPLFGSFISWKMDIKLSSLENYIGSSIAIFTGLFFTLLLSVGDKIRAEKDNKDIDFANYQRYKNSMKQIADLTLYIILLGVYIIVFMLLNSLLKNNYYLFIEKIFTAITIFLLFRFVCAIMFMIQRFFFLVRDEINNI